jgi:phage terminase small subunit
MAKLTHKQVAFVSRMAVVGTSATQAARDVGVPEASAAVTGSRWLKNPVIAAAIADARRRDAAKQGITSDRTLQVLADAAYVDRRRAYDAEGNLIPFHLLDRDVAAAVGSVEDETRTTGDGDKRATVRTQHMKFTDSIRAAELLGKHLGLFGNGEGVGVTVTPGEGGLPPGSSIEIVLVRPE